MESSSAIFRWLKFNSIRFFRKGAESNMFDFLIKKFIQFNAIALTGALERAKVEGNLFSVKFSSVFLLTALKEEFNST